MTTTRPVFTIVLTEYADATWSVEPAGLGQIPGYAPERVGPYGAYLRSPDLEDLLCEQARTIVAAALDLDPYAFDLRFCTPAGRTVARSNIRVGLPPGGTTTMLHENVQISDGLRARIRRPRSARSVSA